MPTLCGRRYVWKGEEMYDVRSLRVRVFEYCEYCANIILYTGYNLV